MGSSDEKADSAATATTSPQGSDPEASGVSPRPPSGPRPLDPPPSQPVNAATTPPGAAEDDEPAETTDDDPYLGTTVGDRYVVDELIGKGGMGRVYLAHHKVIGKKVAIKILHAELAKHKEAVGRFVREAKAASSIGNPHIVDISDFGETADGSTYFVMEYLEGVSLGDLLLERDALDVDLVCDIALQLCDGLAAAHRHDVVHRDLKPDNVTLVKQGNRDNFCKILDFGIAKVNTGASSTKLTMAGAVFGTPHYMSPEQAAGAAVDHRTDIYSLGVMMYEMVSGRMPFNAENFMGILTQHMYKAPVPIRALVDAPDCPPGLEALILKCLSKKPDARYGSMEELAEDLRKFQADGMPKAVQEMMARSGSFHVPADYFKVAGPAVVPATPRGPRPRRLGPRLVAAAGILAAVSIVVFVLMRHGTTTAAPSAEVQAPPAPAPSPAAPSASAAPAEPGKIAVLVYASKPSQATALVNGKEISLPDTFQVEEGKTLSIEVKAEGYVAKTLELDGTETKIAVELEPDKKIAPAVRPRLPQPRAEPEKKSSGPSDVVNPWD